MQARRGNHSPPQYPHHSAGMMEVCPLYHAIDILTMEEGWKCNYQTEPYYKSLCTY